MDQSPLAATDVGQQACQHFIHGLSSGQWAPFLAMLTEDVTIWFPKAPFQGFTEGKERAIAFFQFASQTFNQRSVVVDRITSNATTVMIEVRLLDADTAVEETEFSSDTGTQRAAIAFDVRGDKICGFRQYLLLFHPAQG